MNFLDATLHAASVLIRRLPPFRGLARICSMAGALMIRLGANPVVEARMNDKTRILVDLRTNTEKGAYWSGEYDSDLMHSIKQVFDPESVFVDVGANIGFYSIAIAALIRAKGASGRVIAFEPFEGNYRRLRENIEINQLGRYCSTIQIGLSSNAGDSELTLREDFFRGSSTGNASIPTNAKFDEGFKRVSIRLDRFDSVWPSLRGTSKIDFMKMDIEGHEDLCLRGGAQTIRDNRPIILMEVNKLYYVARGVDLDDQFLPLIPERYGIYRPEKPKWQRINSLDHCDTVDNVLLVPEEKSHQCREFLSIA